MGWLSGLARTRQKIAAIPVDADWQTAWTNRLIAADVGVVMAEKIVGEVAAAQEGDAEGADAPSAADFKHTIARRLQRLEAMMAVEAHQPFVVLVAGVNGSGKTTTIGKLAYHYTRAGKRVLLAAGDTFRAAAGEQLQKWADASGQLEVAAGAADSSAVAFDAVRRAAAQNFDVVMVDTAGRLPTQKPLIDELRKICRSVGKAHATAPHEVLLVLDATTGQNALPQIRAFADATGGITGVVVTKLDGSAKGGFLLAMAEQFRLPVRFVGVGEAREDLVLFDAARYANALIGEGGEE